MVRNNRDGWRRFEQAAVGGDAAGGMGGGPLLRSLLKNPPSPGEVHGVCLPDLSTTGARETELVGMARGGEVGVQRTGRDPGQEGVLEGP